MTRAARLDNAVMYLDSASEASIQRACVELLTLLGWVVVETSQAGPVIRMAGLPDVLAWRNGITILLEMKTARGKLRRSQVEFSERIRPHLTAHLQYFVIRSVDDLRDCLTAIDLATDITPWRAQ